MDCFLQVEEILCLLVIALPGALMSKYLRFLTVVGSTKAMQLCVCGSL